MANLRATDVEVFPSSTLKPVSALSVTGSDAFRPEVDGALCPENIEMSKLGDSEAGSKVTTGADGVLSPLSPKTVRVRARLQFIACCW
jgi:hypothetical protein